MKRIACPYAVLAYKKPTFHAWLATYDHSSNSFVLISIIWSHKFFIFFSFYRNSFENSEFRLVKWYLFVLYLKFRRENEKCFNYFVGERFPFAYKWNSLKFDSCFWVMEKSEVLLIWTLEKQCACTIAPHHSMAENKMWDVLIFTSTNNESWNVECRMSSFQYPKRISQQKKTQTVTQIIGIAIIVVSSLAGA